MAEPRRQWIGLFLAPAVFFARLQLAYVIVPWACVTGGRLWLHLVDLLAVALAVLGGVIAWSVQRASHADARPDGADATSRANFLGVVGLGSSALFALLLAAQATAGVVISPCQ
jgi:hypothetical protein